MPHIAVLLPILLLPVTIVNGIKVGLWLWCMSRSKMMLELRNNGKPVYINKHSFANIYFMSWTKTHLSWNWQPDTAQDGTVYKLIDW